MDVRRSTSYRLLLVRSAIGRLGRAVVYYAVSFRAQVRVWRVSLRLGQRFGAAFGLVFWFVRELPRYVGRVLADRREDRAELRADRRLVAARRKAEIAEIKAARHDRPHALPVPAWVARVERPSSASSLPVPRRALVAGALVLAAAVPGYAVVSGALESDEPSLAADPRALPGDDATAVPAGSASSGVPGAPGGAPVGPAAGAPAAPGAGAPAAPGAGAPLAPPAGAGLAQPGAGAVVTGSNAAGGTVAGPAAPNAARPPVVTAGASLSAHQLHQQREARRAAKAEAKLARDPGK